jgi:hypothetical protein
MNSFVNSSSWQQRPRIEEHNHTVRIVVRGSSVESAIINESRLRPAAGAPSSGVTFVSRLVPTAPRMAATKI